MIRARRRRRRVGNLVVSAFFSVRLETRDVDSRLTRVPVVDVAGDESRYSSIARSFDMAPARVTRSKSSAAAKKSSPSFAIGFAYLLGASRALGSRGTNGTKERAEPSSCARDRARSTDRRTRSNDAQRRNSRRNCCHFSSTPSSRDGSRRRSLVFQPCTFISSPQ